MVIQVELRDACTQGLDNFCAGLCVQDVYFLVRGTTAQSEGSTDTEELLSE